MIGIGIGIPGSTASRGAAAAVRALFANGEQGAWYDPSDLSTLYQDSYGSTPVTAVEQPVGLMLDKRKDLARSADQSVDFSTSAGTGVSYAGKEVTFAAASSGAHAAGNTGIVTNRLYEVVYTISGYVSGSVQLNFGGSTYGVYSESANGTYTEIHRADGIAFLYAEALEAGTTLVLTIQSVKVIEGNHATQLTSASRPVLSARINRLVHTEDLLQSDWQANSGATKVDSKTVQLAASFVSRLEQYETFAIGETVTVSALLSGTGSVFFGIAEAGGAFPQTTTPVELTSTPTRYSVTRVITDSETVTFRVTDNGGSPLVKVEEPMLVLGTSTGRYQRVVTPTNYDTAGFPHYLKPDGVDDNLQHGVLIEGAAFSSVVGLSKANFNGGYARVWSLSSDGIQDYAAGRGVPVLVSADALGIQAYQAEVVDLGITAIALDTPVIATTEFTGTEGSFSVNDGAAATEAAVPSFGITEGMLFAHVYDGGNPFAGKFFGGILLARAFTSKERAAARSFIAQKSGVDL